MLNFLQLSYGSIIRSHTLEIKKKLDETDRPNRSGCQYVYRILSLIHFLKGNYN